MLCTYFCKLTHIKQDIKIRYYTETTRGNKIAHGKCQLLEIMSGLLLEYKVQIYLVVLVDKQFITQGYPESKT